MSSLLSFVTSSSKDEPEDQASSFEVDRISLSSCHSHSDLRDEESDLFMSVQASSSDSAADDLYLSVKSFPTETVGHSLDSWSPNNAVAGPFLFNEKPCWLPDSGEISTRLSNEATDGPGEISDLADIVMRIREEHEWRTSVASNPRLVDLLRKVDPAYETVNSSDLFPAAACSSSGLSNVHVRCSEEGVDEVVVPRSRPPSVVDMTRLALSALRLSTPARERRSAAWLDFAIRDTQKLLSLRATESAPEFPSEGVKGEELVLATFSSPRPDTRRVRDRWIFTLHSKINPRSCLETQNWECAGCGAVLDGDYAGRSRLCEYFGAVFCLCCHKGDKGILPARILQHWNFAEYPLCERASRFLSDVKYQPVIHIGKVAPLLVERIRPLRTAMNLRVKLRHMWQYVKSCTVAATLHTKYGFLLSLFTLLPRHILDEEEDVFSLDDLHKIRSGDIVANLEKVVLLARQHIQSCSECLQRSFVCWLCERMSEPLFPFQTDRVSRCDGCGSLAHLKCIARVKRERNASPECSKCKRIENNRLRRRFVSVGDD